MSPAVYILGGVIAAQLVVIAYLLWANRNSAVPDAMRRQADAEIRRNAALVEAGTERTKREAVEADAAALKLRAERAEEALRVLRAKHLSGLVGDDLAREFERVLSGQEPRPDPAVPDQPARAVGPDGLPLRPVDPFGDGT